MASSPIVITNSGMLANGGRGFNRKDEVFDQENNFSTRSRISSRTCRMLVKLPLRFPETGLDQEDARADALLWRRLWNGFPLLHHRE